MKLSEAQATHSFMVAMLFTDRMRGVYHTCTQSPFPIIPYFIFDKKKKKKKAFISNKYHKYLQEPHGFVRTVRDSKRPEQPSRIQNTIVNV